MTWRNSWFDAWGNKNSWADANSKEWDYKCWRQHRKSSTIKKWSSRSGGVSKWKQDGWKDLGATPLKTWGDSSASALWEESPPTKCSRYEKGGWSRGQYWKWNSLPLSEQVGAESDYVLEASGSDHRCTILWLHSCHGRPCHIDDFVEDLRNRGMIDGSLRIRAPCAPSRPAGPEWSGTSFQWFVYNDDDDGTSDVGFLDEDRWEQLRAQRLRLEEILTEELDRLPHDGRLVIGGLSQGASMTLDLLLHMACMRPQLAWSKLAGMFVRRSMLQPESVHDFRHKSPSLEGFQLLATHGTDDECVDIEKAQKSYAFLTRCGACLMFLPLNGVWHNGHDKLEGQTIANFVQVQLGNRQWQGGDSGGTGW